MQVASELLVIDGIVLWDFDYVDIGRIRLPSHTVPVTVKSLVFSDDPRAPMLEAAGEPSRAHIHGHDHAHHGHTHSHAHHHHGHGALQAVSLTPGCPVGIRKPVPLCRLMFHIRERAWPTVAAEGGPAGAGAQSPIRRNRPKRRSADGKERDRIGRAGEEIRHREGDALHALGRRRRGSTSSAPTTCRTSTRSS